MLYENVSAISTANLPSGVAIIRISGDSPLKIAEKMFVCKTSVKDFEPNKMYVGNILADGLTDHGMCVYFKAPKSYTGEDMVEFHCHGGQAITQAVLKKTFALGARPATRGEFTKRAYLNGKMSLSSCEGLIDLINAESNACAKAGYYLYREKLFNKIKAHQDDLKYVLALIEANIDYPEEDIKPAEIDEIKDRINGVNVGIKRLISLYDGSSKIKNGVKVAIVGKPNVGKSSILNALLGLDKAIVTDIPGTTRDAVEGETLINGVTFRFYDTAGIRESDDAVEKIGIENSKRLLKSADIVLFVVDASRPFDEEDRAVYDTVKDTSPVVVINKSDIKAYEPNIRADISVSAEKGDNIDALKTLLYDKAQVDSVMIGEEFLTEERHLFALKEAEKDLENVLSKIGVMPLDILTVEIDSAWRSLGLISGETVSEAVIDEIFSKFCVGK